jgi:hypothetical protein
VERRPSGIRLAGVKKADIDTWSTSAGSRTSASRLGTERSGRSLRWGCPAGTNLSGRLDDCFTRLSRHGDGGGDCRPSGY